MRAGKLQCRRASSSRLDIFAGHASAREAEVTDEQDHSLGREHSELRLRTIPFRKLKIVPQEKYRKSATLVTWKRQRFTKDANRQVVLKWYWPRETRIGKKSINHLPRIHPKILETLASV